LNDLRQGELNTYYILSFTSCNMDRSSTPLLTKMEWREDADTPLLVTPGDGSTDIGYLGVSISSNVSKPISLLITYPPSTILFRMDMFSSSPLVESFPSSRFSSPPASPTRTEVDLPIEVDQSFNSSMSFSGANDSPCYSLFASPTPNMLNPSNNFLSPTPAFGQKPRRPDPVPIQRSESGNSLTGQLMGSGRAFGRELSTNSTMSRGTSTMGGKGMMLPPAVPQGKNLAQKNRGGIPMQWSSSNEDAAPPKLVFQPAMTRREVSLIRHFVARTFG
jgi:hypothetical protein